MTYNIIVNLADDQTAQALSDKDQRIFNKDLKRIAAATSNVTTFIVKLKNGLIRLIDAVNNNAAPMDVMMIVHTQIIQIYKKRIIADGIIIFYSLFYY